jgi:3-hydroxyisobutyrate dehydrogenase
MGSPWDVANAALFLASDEAVYVNAVCLSADGGLTMRARCLRGGPEPTPGGASPAPAADSVGDSLADHHQQRDFTHSAGGTVAEDKAFNTVGFVGLGAMGSRMVRNLKGAADLLVFDTDQTRAAEAAEAVGGTAVTDLAAMGEADAVILMLPNSAVVDAVLAGTDGSGLLDILASGSLVLDMSSSDPTHTEKNAQLGQERGITLVDAPVSGGIGGAEAGALAIMVGGTEAEFERALPLLDRLGSQITRVGGIGSGHALKALNNLLAATILAATSEVFAVGQKYGLDPAVMHSVINASSGGSFMTNVLWPKAVLPRTWDFGFTLQLMEKDVRVAMSLIEATGVPTVLSEANAGVWARALEQAPPGVDMSQVALQAERTAGL